MMKSLDVFITKSEAAEESYNFRGHTDDRARAKGGSDTYDVCPEFFYSTPPVSVKYTQSPFLDSNVITAFIL